MRPSRIVMMPNWLTLLLTVVQTSDILAQDATPTEAITATTTILSPPSLTMLQSTVSTSSSVPQTHTIQVGLLDHKMRPEITKAAIGDIIQFDFYPLNHSIVRAEYGFPCIPYEMTGADKRGFFSGFNPVDKVLDKPPRYSVRINDTEPIFFYCSAPGSCITYGMVGGINLNGSMSIDKQRTLAMDSSYMLQPGEPFPVESPLSSGSPASSVMPSSSSRSTSAPTSPPAHTSSGALSTGTIVGIAIAAVSALIFGALLFFCWGRTKSLREAIERKDGTVRRVTASPNQMVQHTQPHHAYNTSQAGFHFPARPTSHQGSHPGSPNPGHQQNASIGSAGYFSVPAGLTAKYTYPAANHPAYSALSPASLPSGTPGLNGHPLVNQAANDYFVRGTSAPGYYETFTPGRERVQERPVEMEAITVSNQAIDSSNVDRSSKF